MKNINWNQLLPNLSLEQQSDKAPSLEETEQLKAISQTAGCYSQTIGHGIKAIGHLLATASQAGEISQDAVTDLGWLIENLGELISSLQETGNGVRERLKANQPGA
ncbi:hypothetical protein KC131_03505 [Pseudomonas sp. JQ170]|uniref:hypothetical protein n=1 Tax=unclassified Pseudomonas TaxID=196821 RepID=UPI00264F65BD|nr:MULTISPECIES: hypothetical protein [unclassified Pseudomonas]MDN7139700.1 hypothetical protein [Pseudomonas sp. JQ170]WRO76992.1 hypothetical protein U9R80_04740 [Pseudomonas sp. 170C]